MFDIKFYYILSYNLVFFKNKIICLMECLFGEENRDRGLVFPKDLILLYSNKGHYENICLILRWQLLLQLQTGGSDLSMMKSWVIFVCPNLSLIIFMRSKRLNSLLSGDHIYMFFLLIRLYHGLVRSHW